MKIKNVSILVLLVFVGVGVPCIHLASRSIPDEVTAPADSGARSPSSREILSLAVAVPTVAPVPIVTPHPELSGKGAYSKIGWRDLGTLNVKTGKVPPKLAERITGPVMVPGYIVPLNDGYDFLDTFLLVPEPMMCIHVPAPPPQYVIQVKLHTPMPIDDGFTVWEPFWIKGTLRVEKVKSDLAVAAYQMKADSLEPYQGVHESM